MKQFFVLAIFLFSMQHSIAQSPATPAITFFSATEIRNQAPHNAFTDLLEYKGYVYCCFREASSHIPGSNGITKILRTKDGATWDDFATLQQEGIDLRDPKLSVMPDGGVLCLMIGSRYDTTQKPSRFLGMMPYVAFMGSSRQFTAPEQPVITNNNNGNHCIWRLTWYKGTGYGIDYGNGGTVKLVKTTDGKTFEKITALNIDGSPNEATIRFDANGKMYIVVRREEGDTNGVLAIGAAPFDTFSYHRLDSRLGGPDFIFSPDGQKLLIGTRLFYPDGQKTGIMVTDLTGKRIKTILLEQGGNWDCSYPGMLIKNKQLWVSYYSSHAKKTAIYFTKIPLDLLLN